MSYHDPACEGCQVNVMEIGEYAYILQDDLWAKCGATGYGQMLCIGCVEQRLGRRLVVSDFNEYIPLNCRYARERSKRLQDRMGPEYSECPFCMKAYPEYFREMVDYDPELEHPELFEYPPSVNVFSKDNMASTTQALILSMRPQQARKNR